MEVRGQKREEGEQNTRKERSTVKLKKEKDRYTQKETRAKDRRSYDGQKRERERENARNAS